MHELAVCQGLLSEVERLAQLHHAASVERIEIQWGPLSGVEVNLLRQAFSIARADTIAASAELIVESLSVRVVCKSCGRESKVASNRLVCGFCHDWHTRLLQGDEMLLARVVFEPQADNGGESRYV